MTAKRQPKATGITNAPLEREEEEQEKVPPHGESTIGKARNRKAPPSETRPTNRLTKRRRHNSGIGLGTRSSVLAVTAREVLNVNVSSN